ncbi:MAG: hypothetical protein Q8L27_01115 [archaeon]|nr:hypothetical protein [archaeon]
MNKRGLIGKIFLIIGVIILLIIALMILTAWQAYSLVQTVMEEKIESNIQDINAKGVMINKTDCEKIPGIETSAMKIKSQAKTACWNPLFKTAVDKIQQVDIKCSDIPTLEIQLTEGLTLIKTICANETLMNQLQEITNSLLPTCKNLEESCGGFANEKCCPPYNCNITEVGAFDAPGICITA